MEKNKELSVMENTPCKELLSKWLKLLILAQIATLILPFFSLISFLESISAWISRAVSLAVLTALYQLSPANPRYRKASIFYLIGFLGGILQAFLGTNLLTSAAAICGIVATYQEYAAHSELLSTRDTYLADKWHSLFYWELAAGIIGGFASIAVAILGVGSGLLEDTIVLAAFGIVVLLDLPLGLLRLNYLKKNRCLLIQD